MKPLFRTVVGLTVLAVVSGCYVCRQDYNPQTGMYYQCRQVGFSLFKKECCENSGAGPGAAFQSSAAQGPFFRKDRLEGLGGSTKAAHRGPSTYHSAMAVPGGPMYHGGAVYPAEPVCNGCPDCYAGGPNYQGGEVHHNGPVYHGGEVYPSGPTYQSGEVFPNGPMYYGGELYPAAPEYGGGEIYYGAPENHGGDVLLGPVESGTVPADESQWQSRPPKAPAATPEQ